MMTPTFDHLAILDLDELEALKVVVQHWLDRRGTEPGDVPTPTVPEDQADAIYAYLRAIEMEIMERTPKPSDAAG